MARSSFPPGFSLNAYSINSPFLSSTNEPNQYPAYSLFLGPGQFSKSVATWNNHPIQPSQEMIIVGDPTLTQKQHPQASVEQKKHKRTRSGCFTCRSRRVKCDEARPICDRCKKGRRDCAYPPPPTKSSGRANLKSGEHRQSTQESDLSDDNDVGEPSGLKTIPDDEEDAEHPSRSSPSMMSTTKTGSGLSREQSTRSLVRRGTSETSESSSIEEKKLNKSHTDISAKLDSTGLPPSFRPTSFCPPPQREISTLPGISRLPEDLRFFLAYHREKISHYHYFLRCEAVEFIRESIIEHAMKYEPLLYAVIGFSAYHHALRQPDGKLYNFLKYYNRSLTLLRKSLASGEQHSEATLITILQLTTFEECIGDWVNLVDHQQAAHTLMCELLTPESITANELHRHIFIWYGLFDIAAGLLAGNETILSRDWYVAIEAHDSTQAATHPRDIEKQLAFVASTNRRFAMDMASLYAKLFRGMISMEQFETQNEQLGWTVENMRSTLLQFDDSEYTMALSSSREAKGSDDIFNPSTPSRFFTGPLWDVNFAWVDILATELMFKYQSSLALQKEAFSELGEQAMEVCRIIESILYWPENEVGTMIAFHSSLGIASMFLPKDDKYTMWSRNKFALLEQNGYIYPPKFRASLAEMWRIPEVNDWWLPNNEGNPDIAREIRKMTVERVTNPRDNFREDVRDLKTLFRRINISELGSQNSSTGLDGLATESSPDKLSNQN